MIKTIPVACNNAEGQCTWVGTVGMLGEHVSMCKFSLLACPKECKDDSGKVKQFTRKDLDEHLEEDCPNRDYACEHCGEKGRHAYIQVHDLTCEKKTVTCPTDGCSEKMQRRFIQQHVDNDCQHITLPCKYLYIGCKEKVKRMDMAAHELNFESHFTMALDIINVQQVKCFTLKDGEPIKYRLMDYQMKKYNNGRVNSPSYYTSPNGYKMSLRVFANGHGSGRRTHVSVFAKFARGRHDDLLKWPFIGSITFTLLNQLEDKNHYELTGTATAFDNGQVGDDCGFEQFIPHSALVCDVVSKTQYLKDDSLYFRMSVKPADHKPWLQ